MNLSFISFRLHGKVEKHNASNRAVCNEELESDNTWIKDIILLKVEKYHLPDDCSRCPAHTRYPLILCSLGTTIPPESTLSKEVRKLPTIEEPKKEI